MNPAAAYARLIESGPFDDPDITSYPVRWYFGHDGVLQRSVWRGPSFSFPEYVAPGPVRFGRLAEAHLSREGERRYETWLESLKDHGP